MATHSSSLRESRFFTRLSLADGGDENTTDGNSTTMSGIGIHYGTAKELRLGMYCIIGGFPCRIREITRSAPGKHGHAKLRVVGVGIFDQRKRETSYGADEQVLIPQVETGSNIVCIKLSEAEGTYSVIQDEASVGLPETLVLDNAVAGETTSSHEVSSMMLVTIVTACGHFLVTTARSLSPEEADALTTKMEQKAASLEKSTVLSKKEQRKQRKLLKKGGAVAANV